MATSICRLWLQHLRFLKQAGVVWVSPHWPVLLSFLAFSLRLVGFFLLSRRAAVHPWPCFRHLMCPHALQLRRLTVSHPGGPMSLCPGSQRGLLGGPGRLVVFLFCLLLSFLPFGLFILPLLPCRASFLLGSSINRPPGNRTQEPLMSRDACV